MIDMDKAYQIDEISRQIENNQQRITFCMACGVLDVFKDMCIDKNINDITYEDLLNGFKKNEL